MNVYDPLNYSKWNRRLMNLYWIFTLIGLITEIILLFYLSHEQFLGYTPGQYILNFIVIPTSLMFAISAACEIIVYFSKGRFVNIQPYVITLTCVLLSTVLLSIHYGITVLCAAYIMPVIFSLVYDNKRVLLATFLFSSSAFTCNYILYLRHIEAINMTLGFGDVITTVALLVAAYLICRLALNRYREIIDIMKAAELSAYESEAAKHHAEAEAETRSRFLANMSHEIRTPMNGIIGLTDLALDEENFSERERDYLVKIKSSAVGLLNIINDILDISKIDAGEVTITKKPFSLREILSECETLMKHSAEQKGLRIYFYDKTRIRKNVIGDPTRLRQALLNLLSNAVKFTHSGSVTLLATSHDASTDSNEISVRFEISDTGIGITEEQRQLIFQPFKQADNSATRSFGGTGLGLPITKSIVEAMGGKINVNSIPDVGSRFSFTLEFELSDKEQPRESSVKAAHPFFDGTVLIFEDNAIGRQVAKANFEKLGMKVVLAENGKEGVEIVRSRELQNRPFDIIFMDIHMPVMDGLQATKELIAMNIKAPIIAMTANVMQSDKEAYLSAGMSECLYKPFRTRELCNCLLNYLKPVGSQKVITAPVDRALGVENNAGDESLYLSSLEIFKDEQPKTPEAIEKAVAAADFTLAHRTAHTAKNNANIIGAKKLTELLTILEESLRHDGAYYKPEMLEDYKAELSVVIDYLGRPEDD